MKSVCAQGIAEEKLITCFRRSPSSHMVNYNKLVPDGVTAQKEVIEMLWKPSAVVQIVIIHGAAHEATESIILCCRWRS